MACPTCSRANVPCVLPWHRILRAYVLKCQQAWRAYEVTCQRSLHALVLTYQRALRIQVLTWQRALCAHIQKVSTVFFFEVKLFYWNENSLWNKVETTRITRNTLGLDLSRAFRQKGSSRITISQIHLSFPLV